MVFGRMKAKGMNSHCDVMSFRFPSSPFQLGFVSNHCKHLIIFSPSLPSAMSPTCAIGCVTRVVPEEGTICQLSSAPFPPEGIQDKRSRLSPVIPLHPSLIESTLTTAAIFDVKVLLLLWNVLTIFRRTTRKRMSRLCRFVIYHLKFHQTAEFRANFDLSRDKFIHMTESERSVSNFG